MPRLRAHLALAVLLAPIAANAQPDIALWRFVYPDTKSLVSIDWSRIRESQVGAMIRETWAKGGMMPGFPGVELLDAIDRVLISSPGKNPSDDSAESPMLVAIHGHFDAAQVRQRFARSGAKAQSYNSFQVYRPQSKQSKDMAYVLFDSDTMLYGDAPAVFSALDRNRFPEAAPQPTAAPGSMAARAAEMDAKYEIWAIIDMTELQSIDTFAALFQGNEWASQAQAIEAGLNLRTGLDADFIMRFSSDAIAKRITSELSRAVNFAARDKAVDAQAQDIAKKLKFNVEGSATRISLRLSQQELEKTAQAFVAGQKASARLPENAASNANPGPPLTPSSTPSKPAMIRIEGLDEGTREIPYQDPER
jgi:hypothetical protein